MHTQNVSFQVLTSSDILSHSFLWQTDADAPDCSIELPVDGEVIIGSDSVGKITIDGELQLAMNRSGAKSRVFTWSRRARALGKDGDEATITIYHPNDNFEELTLLITRAGEASLTVEEDDEDGEEAENEKPNVQVDFSSFASIVKAYGAYIVVGLASIGFALSSLLLPEHSQGLLIWSVWLFIIGCLATHPGDPFFKRLLLFIGAGVALCFTAGHPAQAHNLLEVAGVLSLIAVACDN
ncbi:MAG: hypothetical protein KGS72_17515 [Cyanobacteria bacterium REEB67]|nr:hypothetical protein [Cyanobacteria bacterium REEB67]